MITFKAHVVMEATVHELAAKHGLKVKDKSGKAIHDFAYSDHIANDFKKHGYELHYNNKKNHFDVISDEDKQKRAEKDKIEADRRAHNFSSSGKRRTVSNVNGGHHVTGIKK